MCASRLVTFIRVDILCVTLGTQKATQAAMLDMVLEVVELTTHGRCAYAA